MQATCVLVWLLLLTHVTIQEQDNAPQQSDLLLRLPEMNACFNKDSVEDIYTALKELDTEWSQATLKLMTGSVVHTLHDALHTCQMLLGGNVNSRVTLLCPAHQPRGAASGPET